jgi:hypothetical protein
MLYRFCVRILHHVRAALICTSVALVITTGHAETLSVGAIYSSVQGASQSFLRFHNTGTVAGTVAVTLQDSVTGQPFATWTSPSIPVGSEQQYAIAEIERATGNFARPSFYSIAIASNIAGTFQHVLWRAADGTLTNLSTCATGVTSNQNTLSGVHTGLLNDSYPSSIIVNNTGTAATPVTLGIYNANTGAKRGSYTTSSIPAGGQAAVTIAMIEAAVGAPPSDLYHYVIRTESSFAGYLQHLVNNTQAGVITDMTTTCRLDGLNTSVAEVPLRSGAIFSSAQVSSQSFLRLTNTGSSAGTVSITLNSATSGVPYGQWTSPIIAAGSEQQYPITRLESDLGIGANKPSYYTASMTTLMSVGFQHALWRPADGTLTNLSTCSAGVKANRTVISAVHSSLLQTGYPSTVVVRNTAATAASATLGIYNANDGRKLGTYTTESISANGQVNVSVPEIEARVGAPQPDLYHYVIKIEGEFSGYLQHLVNNSRAGVTTDMTTTCTVGAEAGSLSFVSNPSARFGDQCQFGQVSLDGFLLTCGSNGRLRYALPEDLPATPSGGYRARPAWYPPLKDVFRAENPPACPVGGRVTLTHMIVATDQISTSTAQGAMISDHVTPIDHAYISIKALDKAESSRTEADYIPVYAPGDGEIIDISTLGSPRSIRIVIAHGCETYSVIMVMNRLSGVLAGYQSQLLANGYVSARIQVRAGDKIGEQRDNPLDYAINDGAVWLSGYAAPFAYAAGEAWKPYTANVPSYFTPELAALLESKMRRTASPRWGKIDHDIPGTASGNWFLDGTVGYSGRSVESFRTATQSIQGGAIAGKNYVSWSHLSIAPHWDTPDNWIFSAGWWKDARGDAVQFSMDIPAGKATPAELRPGGGIVVYPLRQLLMSGGVGGAVNNGTVKGIVAVEVNADGTLTIEPVPEAQDISAFTGFTAAKRTYRR